MRILFPRRMLAKARIKGYTRKDGVFVAEHVDKRQAAHDEPAGTHKKPAEKQAAKSSGVPFSGALTSLDDVMASDAAPAAEPMTPKAVQAMAAAMSAVELPGQVQAWSKGGASATNQGTLRRANQLRDLAAAGDLDGIANFATSRTRANYAVVDDYRTALLAAAHGAKAAPKAVVAAQPKAAQKPAATPKPDQPSVVAPVSSGVPQPPQITGANPNNTALLAAQRKVAALHAAASGPNPAEAIQAIATSRGNGYLNKADDYKAALLQHFSGAHQPVAAPKPAADPAPKPAVKPVAKTPQQAAPVVKARKAARAAAKTLLDKLEGLPDLHRPANKVGANILGITGRKAEMAKLLGIGEADIATALGSLVVDYGADKDGSTLMFNCSCKWGGRPDSIAVVFLGTDGTRIRREFYKDEKTGKLRVEHVLFEAKTTGGGAAKALFRTSLGVYKALGVEAIMVHANLDVGGYAWAKFGVRPTQESWNKARQFLKNVLGSWPEPAYLSDMSKESRLKLHGILDDPDPKSIYVLSDFHVGEAQVGKTLLLNSNWSGGLRLNDKDGMRRCLSYIAKKPGGKS